MTFLLVALAGVGLILTTRHDGVGIGLLLVGDALMIGVLAVYLLAPRV